MTYIEIVEFGLRPEATEASLARAAPALGDILMRLGALAHHAGRDDSGHIVHVVVWPDRLTAQAGMRAVSTSPQLAPFLAAARPGSARMRHVEPLMVA